MFFNHILSTQVIYTYSIHLYFLGGLDILDQYSTIICIICYDSSNPKKGRTTSFHSMIMVSSYYHEV